MILVSLVKIGAGVYVGLGMVLFFQQSRIVYYPTKPIEQTPQDVGLAYEAVTFPAADGVTLSGWYVPVQNARGTILLCHGNGGNISHRLYPIQLFHGMKLNVFIFDYRGYGQSAGKPGETGTYQDALGAWTYLTQTRATPPEKIVVLGRSLGGGVASWLAEQHKPAGLILESTFTSVPDLGAKMYPYLPVRLLCRFKYNTAERLPRIQCPVLVAHSRGDELVPFSHGQKLFAAANEPKTFAELVGSHNDGESSVSPEYRQTLERFLQSALAR